MQATREPFATFDPRALVDCARGWIGVPFRHGGRDRSGVDCVGLVIVCLHELGVTDWDETAYSRTVNPDRLRKGIERFADRVTDLRAGDLLLFHVQQEATHVGLCAGDTVIHAHVTAGHVCEHALDERWRRRIAGVYRWRGCDG